MTLSRCANYGCRVVHCLVFDPGGVEGSRRGPHSGHEAVRAMETKLNNSGKANCQFVAWPLFVWVAVPVLWLFLGCASLNRRRLCQFLLRHGRVAPETLSNSAATGKLIQANSEGSFTPEGLCSPGFINRQLRCLSLEVASLLLACMFQCIDVFLALGVVGDDPNEVHGQTFFYLTPSTSSGPLLAQRSC